MEKELNFKTYENSWGLILCPIVEKYISIFFGNSHVICSGDVANPPLILLHVASCGSPIWYKNISFWIKYYRVYAINLIGESSKCILTKKLKSAHDNAKWLNETLMGLKLNKFILYGLSIGGWNADNYAIFYPQNVIKLISLSPVQTFAKIYSSIFIKIMKMWFNPTRKNVEGKRKRRTSSW